MYDIYVHKEVSTIRVSSSFLYQEEEDDTKAPETLINWESNDLNLHNNHAFVYCAFPGNLL